MPQKRNRHDYAAMRARAAERANTVFDVKDLNLQISSLLANCKDEQALLVATRAGDGSYADALKNRYGSFRTVYNRLCHLETYCPIGLPELDYTQTPASKADTIVEFDFQHPINDGRTQNGETFVSTYTDDVYKSADVAKKFKWEAEISTWNAFQRQVKNMSNADINQMKANWIRKINDGTWTQDPEEF